MMQRNSSPLAAGVLALAAMTMNPGSGRAETVARTWNEENLAAIRVSFPDPPVHARNLFHVSVAMYDAWAVYDDTAVGYVHHEKQVAPDLDAARHMAISHAAYRVLSYRYGEHPHPDTPAANAAATQDRLDDRMAALGYVPWFTSTTGTSPAAVGNRVAQAVLAYAGTDGSNELGGYSDGTYSPVNDPLILLIPGSGMANPNRWQPLAFDVSFTQNGIEADQVQTFIGSHWGDVRPFALHRAGDQEVYHDPGMPPQLGGDGDAEFKANNVQVIRFSSWLDPDDGVMVDCSPAGYGNNSLGANDGAGHAVNPATGSAYAPVMVKRADFGRVLAEFWADGPDSETPPGHWNTLANRVVEHPDFEARVGGTGPVLDPLEWDVKMYLALNASVHDVGVAIWGCKRAYDYVRPISSIRYMCRKGQSSDPGGPSYHPEGITLEPGLVEVVTPESSAPGERHADLAASVGKIAIHAWGGEPADPATQYSGSKWIRGDRWLPYQRDTFVTPAFAGYVSGHSAFSRAAAEVLAAMTGSPYFPGGFGSHPVPAGSLDFEFGPSEDVTLQWATYYDAADQAGISRLYGGIHVAPDDGPGRIMGSKIGKAAWVLASKYYDGRILQEPLPVRATRQANGDLHLEWDQVRGMRYAVRTTSDLRGFADFMLPTQALTDTGSLLVPAAALPGPRHFLQVRRTTGE
jgi:hypothetical protein